jgi:3-hydroxyisobutyrate dehydrogenase
MVAFMAEISRSIKTVGLVGIGSMGWPMGARLVQAGYRVIAHDARDEHAAQFAKETGGEAALSLAALGSQADVVITMLPNSVIVEDVLYGAGGLAASLRPGTTLIEMSSGIPSATRALSARLIEQGIHTIDAPVSGGVKRAVSGELAIMAGGEASDIDVVEPVLKAMGRSILRTGALGSGQAMKALNNLVSAAGFLVGIEALLIGQAAGLDPAMMVDVLNVSTGRNNSTDAKFKQFVLSRKFDSGFSLDLMVKDLGIALEVADEGHTAAPFSTLCREMWSTAAKTLGPGNDHTAVAKYSEKLAGATLESK